MRVLVAGATGVVGWRAVRDLTEAGHQVTAVVRSEAKAERIRDLGATPVAVDLWDRDSLTRAAAGHQVVCNLATHIPPMTRAARSGAWADNDRIRTEGSTNLIDAAIAGGADRFVQESITFVYADGGDQWLDEAAPVGPTAITASSLVAEAQAARFTAAGGVAVVLRFALFYAADSSHCVAMLKAARRRLSPAIGAKTAYQSSIHADDAARAVVAALELPAGITNVGDDEPVTKQEFSEVVAAAAGAGSPHYVGGVVSRLSGRKAETMSRSQRIANGRLRAAGWSPAYRSVREGWPVVAAEILGASRRA
jgi:nucleoside-diphosphate-sugar epimerase